MRRSSTTGRGSDPRASAGCGKLARHRPDLRVVDIAAAFGLAATGVRSLAGPRVIEVDCADCLTPVYRVRRSRSHHPAGPEVRCGRCLDRIQLASMEWGPAGSPSSRGPIGRAPGDDGRRGDDVGWDDGWDDPPASGSWPWP